MYITRTLLVLVKEKAIIQSRKQVQSIGRLHIFLAVSRFPTQRLPVRSLLRNFGNDNHVAYLVSGKRYVLAGIVDWGLKGDKLVPEARRIQIHRSRDNFPCTEYS